jgi:uncharacterized membrane protein
MFFISAITMLCLDAIYLSTFKSFYNNQIKMIQGGDIKMKIMPTIFVYIALLIGLNYFILSKKCSVKDAFLLGIVIYAVFDLTNMAIFDKWKIESVLLDTLWGGILFALTTFITYRITSFFA